MRRIVRCPDIIARGGVSHQTIAEAMGSPPRPLPGLSRALLPQERRVAQPRAHLQFACALWRCFYGYWRCKRKEVALTTKHGDRSSPEAPWEDCQRRNAEHKNGQSPGPSTARQLNTLNKGRLTRASHLYGQLNTRARTRRYEIRHV